MVKQTAAGDVNWYSLTEEQFSNTNQKVLRHSISFDMFIPLITVYNPKKQNVSNCSCTHFSLDYILKALGGFVCLGFILAQVLTMQEVRYSRNVC